VGRRPFQDDNQRVTTQVLVSEVKEGDNAVSEIDGMGAFAVNVKGLRGARDMQDDSIEFDSQIGCGEGHVVGVGQGCQSVTREKGHQEVQGVFLSDIGGFRTAAWAAIITPIVRCE
jgi:hypothetical protein